MKMNGPCSKCGKATPIDTDEVESLCPDWEKEVGDDMK